MQKEVPMTTTHQFEWLHIMLSMIKRIKLTLAKWNEKLFTIECFMPTYEPQNTSVCKPHSKMFKNDTFTFHPSNDLVLSMQFKFVDNLELGRIKCG